MGRGLTIHVSFFPIYPPLSSIDKLGIKVMNTYITSKSLRTQDKNKPFKNKKNINVVLESTSPWRDIPKDCQSSDSKSCSWKFPVGLLVEGLVGALFVAWYEIEGWPCSERFVA